MGPVIGNRRVATSELSTDYADYADYELRAWYRHECPSILIRRNLRNLWIILKSLRDELTMATLSGSALVFVYNADSGLFNTITDIVHKALSPETYQCNLCALTHSNFGMHRSWKSFLQTLGRPIEFLHADELHKKYRISDIQLPAVFKKEGDRLELVVSARSINDCRTLDQLKQLIVELG